MRLKYYIRGFGLGIVFATLLLSISFYFGKDNFKKQELSEKEIIERAKELGMVAKEDVKDEAKKDKKSDKSQEEAPVAAEETDAEKTSKKVAKAKKDITLEEAIESESDASKAGASESSESTVTYVPFTIRAGATSESVSTELQSAGLIANSTEFNKYINKLGVDDRIQAGTFYVQKDCTYDDLIALLVNKDARTTTPPKPE